MIYSYTQISQYLTCPRRYRHRYLDGWQEKDTRAAMLFGRAFERALAAFFLRQDAAAALFQEWNLCQDQKLEYSHGDTWDRMLEQGIQLLDRFCQDDRVRIPKPRGNLQIKFTRQLSAANEFVAFIDAIGQLDGRRSLIEWKTTASRYSEAPDGLLALDPQLVCYSWMTGISDVVHKARVLPKEQFRHEVDKELTGKETEPWEIIYFKLYKSQIPVIEQALETAALMLGSDRSRGYCLEMICADFLAGANLDSGDPNVLLRALSSSFKFLPENQRQAFLQIVNEQIQ